MGGATRQAAVIALAFLGLALLLLAGLTLAGTFGAGLEPFYLRAVAVAVVLAAGLVLWHLLEVLKKHFTALERLRGAVVTLAADPGARLPPREDDDSGREIGRLHDALGLLAARRAADQALPDVRLQAVLASIPEAMVVITDQGQVSLVNHAAKSLLGAERVACGTSVYAALSRHTVLDAVERSRRAEGPVDAMIGTLEDYQLTAKVVGLPEHGGAVLTFPPGEVAFRAELEVDLSLHDQPPPPMPVSDATPLESLPILVLDTETTGLDVEGDRVVSVGAVRLVGGRIYRSTSFDRLVNPGMPIPARSTAVHGITDAMVEAAPPFAEVFRDLRPLATGTVTVGHHVAFDLRMLSGECRRAGLDWQEPPWLDTLLLAAALEPDAPELSLDALAGRFGVSVHGRHTALGDSLVTAELFARLLPRLGERGVTTFGAARAFGQRATTILYAQDKAGW